MKGTQAERVKQAVDKQDAVSPSWLREGVGIDVLIVCWCTSTPAATALMPGLRTGRQGLGFRVEGHGT